MGIGEFFIILVIAVGLFGYVRWKNNKEVQEIKDAELEEATNPLFEDKVEPKVLKVDSVPSVEVKEIVKVTKASKASPKKSTKVKKAWYNNGKEQKLIPIDQEVETGWVKGKLPKGGK